MTGQMSGVPIRQADRRAACRAGARAWLLAAGILLMQVGAGLPAPVYPRYLHTWELSPAALTGMFATLIAGVVLTLLLIQALVDRYGARTVLLGCCALAALAAGAFAHAGAPVVIFAGHALQGIAVGGFTGVAPLAMADPELRGGDRRVGGLVAAGNAVGLAAGPLISGLLLQYAPWPGRLAFVLQLAAVVVLGIGVARCVPGGRLSGGRPVRPRLRVAGGSSWFFVLCAAGACAFALGGLYSALGPVTARDLLGVRSETMLGLVVSLMFTANAVAGPALLRRGEVAALRFGLGLIVGGLALVAASPYAGGLAGFLAGTVAAGAGQGAVIAAGTAEVSRMSGAVPTFFLVCYLGTAAAALGTGVLATHAGLAAALLAFSAVIAMIGAALAVHMRKDPTV